MNDIKTDHAQAAYLYAPEDPTRTRTAQRATFNPSLRDRITNRLANQDHPRLAGFVNSLRVTSLKLRDSSNNRALQRTRDRFDALSRNAVEDDDEERHALKTTIDNRTTQQARIEVKKTLAQNALKGKYREALADANQEYPDMLREKGYTVQATDRATTPSNSATTNYLISQRDGHRVRVNTERPPGLARMVASSRSEAYDKGTSGGSWAAARSTVQHALVGVQQAALYVKGSTAGKLSRQQWMLDDGSRRRLEASSRRAADDRSMLSEAFHGNDALNQAFDAAVQRQRDQAARMVAPAEADAADGPRYEIRQPVRGVKPPRLNFLERRMVARYSKPVTGEGTAQASAAEAIDAAAQADQSGPALPRRAGRMMQFAVEISVVGARASSFYHQGMVGDLQWKALSRGSREAEDKNYEKLAEHVVKADAKAYPMVIRRSAMQGLLQSPMTAGHARNIMEGHFPLVQDVAAPPPASVEPESEEMQLPVDIHHRTGADTAGNLSHEEGEWKFGRNDSGLGESVAGDDDVSPLR